MSVIDPVFSLSLCVQDFEALQGRADGKTAFYEALSRSLGGAKGSELLKEAAAWFYSLDHSPSPAGYNLFSRALNNATRSDTAVTSVRTSWMFHICAAVWLLQFYKKTDGLNEELTDQRIN